MYHIITKSNDPAVHITVGIICKTLDKDIFHGEDPNHDSTSPHLYIIECTKERDLQYYENHLDPKPAVFIYKQSGKEDISLEESIVEYCEANEQCTFILKTTPVFEGELKRQIKKFLGIPVAVPD